MPQHRQRSTTNRSGMLSYQIADEDGSGFQSFPVLSNSIGFVQSEEMVSLPGGISWKVDPDARSFQVSNGSQATVEDVQLIGLNDQGQLLMAKIGSLAPNATIDGKLIDADDDKLFSTTSSDENLDTPTQPNNKVSSDLDQLKKSMDQILGNYPLQSGEWIALGWTDTNLSKLEITPTTPQSRSQTIVLMHARNGRLGPIEHDLRIMPPRKKDDEDL